MKDKGLYSTGSFSRSTTLGQRYGTLNGSTITFSVFMLTAPYHFSIVAAPCILSNHGVQTEILYRGSIPAARNLPFVRRLKLRTIIYLRKKQLKEDDGLVRWAEKRGIELKWVSVEDTVEENLGMGKVEVGEVLKVIDDNSLLLSQP